MQYKKHKIKPIDIYKVPFRYRLHIKPLDGEATIYELLYNIIYGTSKLVEDEDKWGEHTFEYETPLSLSTLKKHSNSIVIPNLDNFEDYIKTLIEMKCIIKAGVKYRIINHPW